MLALLELGRLDEAAEFLDRAIAMGAADLYPGVARELREALRADLAGRDTAR
jgi:hypothetical protein